MHFSVIASSFPMFWAPAVARGLNRARAFVALVCVVLHHILFPFSSLNISQYLNAAFSVPGCFHCNTNIFTERNKRSLYVKFDIFLLIVLSNCVPIVPNGWAYICILLGIVQLSIVCDFRLAHRLCALFAPLSSSTILIVFLHTSLMVVCKPFSIHSYPPGFRALRNSTVVIIVRISFLVMNLL